mgnify:CR=1 FL=1
MVEEVSQKTEPLKVQETPLSNDGQKPLLPVIEEAIKMVELEKDLAQLQQQALLTSGAIQYIQQKITVLRKLQQKEITGVP